MLMSSPRWATKSSVLIVLLMLMSACGWHFRGTMNVALAIEQLAVVDKAGDGLLEQVLLKNLSQAGVVVTSAGKDIPVLTLRNVQKTRKALTLVAGSVEEYKLVYKVEFDVERADGHVILPRQDIEISRVYSYDAGQVLAKNREQLRLYQEMRHEVATALLYRLQAISREAM